MPDADGARPRGRRAVRLTVAALALAVAALLLWPRAPGGVSIIGDGAPAVAAALDLPEGAAARAVLLRRAGSLRHLPEIDRLCRGRCGPGLTVLRVLGPGGGDRLVFEMSDLDGVEALDRGEPLPEPAVACLAGAIAAEAAGRAPPPCVGARRLRVVLPYGL